MRATKTETNVQEVPQWQAVGLVIDQNHRDIMAKRYGVVPEVVSWFKALALFRQAEFSRMIEREPTVMDRRHHKTWLTGLIAEGERLLTEIRARGTLPANEGHLKLSDVEATVKELYDTQAEWYGDMPAARRTEWLHQIFHVSPT